MRKQSELTGLTIEELRTYKGLEKLSDKDAQEAIETIEKLTMLLYRMAKKEKSKKEKSKKEK